jgi:hypothetical protein
MPACMALRKPAASAPRLIASLAAASASGAISARRLASFSVSAESSSRGTTRLTMPRSSAVAASIMSPRYISSRAFL